MSANHFPGGGQGGKRLAMALAVLFFLIWISGIAAFYLGGHEKNDTSPAEGSAHESALAPPSSHGEARLVADDKDAHAASIWKAGYWTLQLFHFHDTHYPSEGVAHLAVRYAAAVYGLGWPVVILAFVFQGHLRRWWFLRKGHHGFVVVVGGSEGVRKLGEDIRKNGSTVVWVTEALSGHEVPGVLHLEGNLEDASFWRHKVGPHRAREIVIMAGSDAENVSISLAIEEAAAAAPKSIPCHVHLVDLHLKKGLFRLLPGPRDSHPLRRTYFSTYEIIARLFAREFPPPVFLTTPTEAREHFVLVGFGQFGQNIALRIQKLGLQVVREDVAGTRFELRKPRVTVIDREGEKAVNSFLRAQPGFTEICDLQVVQADCRDEAFQTLSFLSDQNAADQCSLIFCLENESLVVGAILDMLDLCQAPEKDIDGIFLRCARRDGLAHLLHSKQSRLRSSVPIHTFAADEEVYTEGVLLNRSLDRYAALIHAAYCNIVLPGTDPQNAEEAALNTWKTLSDDDRESNREAADHIWAKVATLGYRLAPNGAGASPDNASLISKIAEHRMELLRAEHHRWMAWRLAGGWTYGEIKSKEAKTHNCLKPFEELSEKDQEKDGIVLDVLIRQLQNGSLRAEPSPKPGPASKI